MVPLVSALRLAARKVIKNGAMTCSLQLDNDGYGISGGCKYGTDLICGEHREEGITNGTTGHPWSKK